MKTQTIISKYKNVIANVNGKMVNFNNYQADVDSATALALLSRPGYSVNHLDSYKTAKRLCIARNMGIGDVLFVLTVPAYIKKINPKCHITFLTFNKHMRLLEGNPHIDKVDDIIKLNDINYPDNFDYIMNFNTFFEAGIPYDKGNSIHRVDMLRMHYKVKPQDWDTSIYLNITNEERTFAKRYIEPLRIKKLPVIGVITQATEVTRRYPENTKLITYLADRGYGVVVLSPGDHNKYNNSNIVNMAGKTNLGQLIGLIDEVDLVITPDSGPLHIAGALNKKIITFFNSFPPIVRTRYYKDCFAFYPESGCPRKLMPCGYSKCTAPCLRTITPQMFETKIKEMLGGK